MKCSVKSCKKGQRKADKSISLHRYPTDEWKKKQWMSILKVDVVHPHSMVCSKHFYKEDFINNIEGQKKMLFPSAMPHLSEEFQNSEDGLSTCTKFVCEELFDVEEENIEEENVEAANVEEENVEEENIEEENFEEEILEEEFVEGNVSNGNVSVVELQVTPVTDEILLNYQTAHHYVDILPSTSLVPSTPSAPSTPSVPSTSSIPSTSSVIPQNGQKDYVETIRIIKPNSLKRAMESSDDDDDSSTSSNLSPRKKRMKTKLKTLRESIKKKNRTIKTLNGKVRRQQKRLDSLKETIANIKKGNFINIEVSEI